MDVGLEQRSIAGIRRINAPAKLCVLPNTGDALVANILAGPLAELAPRFAQCLKAGGALAMMEDAWWGATILNPDGKDQHGFVLNERSDPWSLVVDQNGNRYLDESESYVDFGHHMLEHDKKTKGKAIPSWLVTDHRHATHFMNSTLLAARHAKQKLMDRGELVEADAARSLRDAAYAVTLAKRAATRLFEATGGRGIYLASPMQRAFRDVQASGGHGSLNWERSALRYARSAMV